MKKILFAMLAIATMVLNLNAQTPAQTLTDFSVSGFNRRMGPTYLNYRYAPETFPTYYMPATKVDPYGNTYELGSWVSNPGLFSSTQGQIAYLADNKQFSLDRITVLRYGNRTYSESPRGPKREPQTFHWPLQSGVVVVDMARGKGAWSNFGIAILSDGTLATAGTSTSHNTNPILKLPPEKVPTSISITPKNEFALVTIYDKVLNKGQVAVIALTSWSPTFYHEWKVSHPCMYNVAVFTNMKLLGYLDLPMKYPTKVRAMGDSSSAGFFANGRLVGPKDIDLSQQYWRDMFNTGEGRWHPTKSGYAVVLGKYENKATVIDLQPLFDRVCQLYFTTQANYNKTRNQGPAANQWPYAFSFDAGWKPKIVTTIAVSKPTAVLGAIGRKSDRQRCFIAREDGYLLVFTVGNLNNTLPALSSDFVYIRNIQVGNNPTCLAYETYSSLIVVSRGKRMITWVSWHPTPTDVRIDRTLRDSRMVDPVCVELADTHLTYAKIINVVDFNGRKVLNYRYSEVQFPTADGGGVFGMGPDGKAEFECGGVLNFLGYPHLTTSTNVN